jgi:predicted N-acyltransferase
MSLEAGIEQGLAGVDPHEWNALGEADYPFTRYEFLSALERHHCLEEFGWQPVHIALRENGKLIAAAPCYIKYNSYGELVFDQSWANAYQRGGGDYYPKLVTAIPYTPATGPRLLVHRDITEPARILELQRLLIEVIKKFCIEHKLSGWHCLFEREATVKSLHGQQLLYRYDCQYHWKNHDYRTFDDFLARLSSRKRKNIRRERAAVQAENLTIERRHGHELDADEWRRIHELYAGIFDRKYGAATLTRDFFQSIGRDLRERVMVVLVRVDGIIIAASLFLVSDSTLFGRVWGCDAFYSFLHFECCYYQGIEYCIDNGLETFDPGAQGEHKISRGFLPTRTCSAHWMVDEGFQAMLAKYLPSEENGINDYCEELMKKSPYRQEN